MNRHISAYAPDHLPSEIDLIDLISERVPSLPQVACFDTAFHRGMPRVAKILPFPATLRRRASNATVFTAFPMRFS